MWEKDFPSWSAFFAALTTDIGFDAVRCDCFRNDTYMYDAYETIYYHNAQFDFNITFTALQAIFRGAHVPMGYYPSEERDPDVLYAGRLATIAFGGDDVDWVVDSMLEHLGPVDDVVVAVGGLWPTSALSPDYSPAQRDAYMAAFERLLLHDR